MADLFLIAEVLKVYDTYGYFYVKPYSDFPERYNHLEKVYLEVFGEKRRFFIEDVFYDNEKPIFKFKNIEKSEYIRFLIGKKIYIEENNLIQLSDDTFYIHDLVESKVYKNDTLLGKIEDVYLLPANDVYVVKGYDGKEILIPAIKDCIESFDKENKIMVLKSDFDLDYDEN